jgi:hypothetical protein
MSNLGGRLDLATATRLVAIRRQNKGLEQTGDACKPSMN